MPDTATHVLILTAGRFEAGLGAFGFSIRGLTSIFEPAVGSGVLPPPVHRQGEKGPVTAEYAALAAMGKALALCVVGYRAAFGPETLLTLCTDCQAVADYFQGKLAVPAELAPLVEGVKEKVALLGCKRALSCIPRGQNVEADTLARASLVGRLGKPLQVGKGK